MRYIKQFVELSKGDASIAGGKGASLGEMTQAGIPVPPGFVVLANAFDKFLVETDIGVKIAVALDTVKTEEVRTVEEASEKIQTLILSAAMPPEVVNEIISAHEQLGIEFVAVRSSATAEDSASAAWAGQLDSFLNTTKETLLQNVQKCWASLFTPRAIFYGFEKGFHVGGQEKVDSGQKRAGQDISVAVVVQAMVQSEVSGIAFSVHPVTQDRNQLIIEAGYGLGEAIVSGQVTPDSYVVTKNPLEIIDKNISTQDRMLVRSVNGGNEWISCPPPRIGGAGGGMSIDDIQKLSDTQILELSRLILKIEKHYGFPCDIEWAFVTDPERVEGGGQFYITQSRPITTLTGSTSLAFDHVDLSKYEPLFQLTRVPFFVNDILLENYRDLFAVFIQRGGMWYSFIPHEVVNRTLEDGMKFFANKADVDKWLEEFEDYRKNSREYFENTLLSPTIQVDTVKSYIGFIVRLHFFYIKTEYFFTDRIFNIQSALERKHATEIIAEVKSEAREYLNEIFFGPSCYISRLLKRLSDEYKVSMDDLFEYSIVETYELMNGSKVAEGIIQERKLAYATICTNSGVIMYTGERAVQYPQFALAPEESAEVISGQGIVKGVVRGVARIFKEGYDKSDESRVKFYQSFQPGEVLVVDSTSPRMAMLAKKAAAIITNQSGLLSHAAIISREFGIPTIVGTKVATHILHDGDLVEVNANTGIVTILEKVNV